MKSPEVIRALHKMIAKVTKDIDGFSFNTAVAAMMIFVNEVYVAGSIDKNSLATFVKVFAPFAPHVANELWEKLCMDGFAEAQPWPVADASLAADDELNIAVQVKRQTARNRDGARRHRRGDPHRHSKRKPNGREVPCERTNAYDCSEGEDGELRVVG